MRWIVGGISAVVGLAVLLAAAVLVLPAEPVAGLAAQRLTAATGRAVVIEGPVRVTLWPRAGVRTGPVSIAGPDWSDLPDRPMLRARALDIGLDAGALMGGRVALARLEADGAEVVLERHPDGRVNWAFGGPPAPGAPGPAAPVRDDPLAGFDRLRLTDAAVTVRDGVTGARNRLEGLTLELARDGEAATLAADGTLDGTALGLEARAAPGLAAGLPGDLALTLTTGGARVTFDGRADPAALRAEGRLEARAEGPALAALGLPPGLAARRAAVTGATVLTPGSVALRDGRLTLDDTTTDITAELALTGPRPRLTGRVAAPALDLRRAAMQGGTQGSAQQSAQGTAPGSVAGGGWSTARIDAGALHLLDADVAVSAPSVRLDGVTLGAVRGALTVDAGRAVLRLDRAEAFGGEVAGEVVANARGGFSARANLAFEGLSAAALMAALADSDGLEGRVSGTIALLGVGNSVDALMRALSGDGRVTMGPGLVRGFDLGTLLRDRDPRALGQARTTPFDGLSATFTVANGVASNGDLVLSAPALRAEGAGRVDIGAQRLDYRLTAAPLEGPVGLRRVRLPVTITGPWADPQLSVDFQAVVREQLEDRLEREVERRRDDAADAIRRELERALGVPST
ncbi:AsmA family protein, partial [Rhodobaculum claviforme]